MKKQTLFLGAALLCAASFPAQAVTCSSNGFDGGIPDTVTTLTISDDAGNSVDITDFATKTVVKSDPDNSSAAYTYDSFTFGSAAQTAITNAGLSMATGTTIKGSTSDFFAEVVCD